MNREISTSVTKIVEVAEGGVRTIEETIDTVAAPVRGSLLKRFPVLFTLLVTFGVVMTFLGAEQLVMSVPILFNNPILTLIIGVTTLVITGTLYKKLG
jgi:hypothetical protein